MAKASAKKVVEKKDTQSKLLTDVKGAARSIWLAGLGAYSKAGQESSSYFKELVKAGEGVE